MLKDAGLDGYFTNHSLRRTAAARLFQAGQNVKLIKEFTVHISDAVEKYEMTSDQQRMQISSIIQGEGPAIDKVEEHKVEVEEIGQKEEKGEGKCLVSSIQNAIESAIKATGNHKAKLTITIELID